MASRITQTVVHFSSAFRLPGFDAPQPAGDYRVERRRQRISLLAVAQDASGEAVARRP